MVKQPIKTLQTEKNPINHTSDTPLEYSTPKKSRQEINRENYKKRKEQRKEKRRERYQQQKEQTQSETQEKLSKYYEAEAIKILMSLKKYTELNREKKQLWLDFNWTLQDCQKSFKEGYADIVFIMKLEEVANKLVRDYWKTAKNEEKQKGRSWNILDYDEQQRLIRYWGYEKARVENSYIEEQERLEKQSREYLKEIERAKFHEERGKIKCKCYACEEKKTIRKEVKVKIDKELKEAEKQWNHQIETDNEKGECNECGKIRVLDEENGLCKKYISQYE